METDSVIIYQKELYKTKKIINILNEMDFNTTNYENNIYVIEETLKNNNKEAIAKNLNTPFIIDYLRINYSEAINKLRKIQRELSKYEIYIKIESFANILINTIENFDDIKEKELDNLIPEAISILKTNYQIYQVEENIIEDFYKIIYYLLKEEIKLSRKELYNTLINNTIHTMYLDKEISSELNKLDKENPENNEIFNKKHIIELNTTNNHYLNYELLSLLVKNNSQEKDINNLKELIPLYQKINNKLNNYREELDNINGQINTKNIGINKHKKPSRYFKNIGSMLVSVSLIITMFGSIHHIKRGMKSPISSNKNTITTYSTKDNKETSTEEFNSKDIKGVTVVKYEPYQRELGGYYRYVTTYNLGELNELSNEEILNLDFEGINIKGERQKETINTLNYEEAYNEIYYTISKINVKENNDALEITSAVMALSISLFGLISCLVSSSFALGSEISEDSWAPGLIRGILHIIGDIYLLNEYENDKEILIQDKNKIITEIKNFINTYDKELRLLSKYNDYICQHENTIYSKKLKYYLENINNNINHIKENESTYKTKKKIKK